MKQCPRCKQTYSDDQLNFCLDDGEILTSFMQEPDPRRYADDSPPTVVLKEPRITNATSWPESGSPVQQWQPPGPATTPMGGMMLQQSRDQTLPTVALVLGIGSIALICCYGGIWLGLPAAVIGFLGMRNSDQDPARYGGRGLAIGGMVLGIVSFLGSLIIALFAIIAR